MARPDHDRDAVGRTDATFALGVEVPHPAAASCDVWSPILRRHARISAADASFLRRFDGGLRLSGEPSASLHVYLRLQKYLRLGVLVEELTLTPDELGGLHVGATPGEVRADGSVAAGRDAMRVRELCDGSRHSHGLHHATLRVCRRPDGQLALLESAEVGRAAFLRGRLQRVHVLQPADFVRRVVDAPADFFGTMRGDVPYQSLCCDGEELVAGRRRALYERLGLVRTGDLTQRAVLDVGCNIGMNCYLAMELGARAATGVDRPELVSAAARLNGFYGRPCRFLAADVNRELADVGRHETVFVFSVLGHLQSVEGLLGTIQHACAQVVYVETHRDGDFQGELERLMEDRRFRRVEFLGQSESSAYEHRFSRSLYRCEVRGGSS